MISAIVRTRSSLLRPMMFRTGAVRPFFSSTGGSFTNNKSSDTTAPNSSQNNPTEAPTNNNPTTHNNEGQSASQSVITEYTSKITTLEDSLRQLKDTHLRTLADAENLRARTRREKELAQQLAIKSFAKDLLNVGDILELALDSVSLQKQNDQNSSDKSASAPDNRNECEKELKNLYEGLKMTCAELQNTFRRHGLVKFVPETGTPFDPNESQAMFQIPIEGSVSGSVHSCQKSGYRLNGIVLRAAQVGIVQ